MGLDHPRVTKDQRDNRGPAWRDLERKESGLDAHEGEHK